MNFHEFISNNNLPTDYKKPSKEIYEFMSSSTAIFVELDQELNKLAQDGSLFKADFSFTKHLEKANGRKQKEIEKFLNEKTLKLQLTAIKELTDVLHTTFKIAILKVRFCGLTIKFPEQKRRPYTGASSTIKLVVAHYIILQVAS